MRGVGRILLLGIFGGFLLCSGCTLGMLGYYLEEPIAVQGGSLISENQVIDLPYDSIVTLSWEKNSSSDLDLFMESTDNQISIAYDQKMSQIDEDNTAWLDYDYRKQGETPEP